MGPFDVSAGWYVVASCDPQVAKAEARGWCCRTLCLWRRGCAEHHACRDRVVPLVISTLGRGRDGNVTVVVIHMPGGWRFSVASTNCMRCGSPE